MDRTCRKILVFLAMAVTLIAVQNVLAETVEVSGIITAISTQPNVVTVDETDVNGVKLKYLCNQYNLCLAEGETVSFDTYEYTCSDGSIKLMATAITVGDVTVEFR